MTKLSSASHWSQLKGSTQCSQVEMSLTDLWRRRRSGLDGADGDGSGRGGGGGARRLAVAVVAESGENGQVPSKWRRQPRNPRRRRRRWRSRRRRDGVVLGRQFDHLAASRLTSFVHFWRHTPLQHLFLELGTLLLNPFIASYISPTAKVYNVIYVACVPLFRTYG